MFQAVSQEPRGAGMARSEPERRGARRRTQGGCVWSHSLCGAGVPGGRRMPAGRGRCGGGRRGADCDPRRRRRGRRGTTQGWDRQDAGTSPLQSDPQRMPERLLSASDRRRGSRGTGTPPVGRSGMYRVRSVRGGVCRGGVLSSGWSLDHGRVAVCGVWRVHARLPDGGAHSRGDGLEGARRRPARSASAVWGPK